MQHLRLSFVVKYKHFQLNLFENFTFSGLFPEINFFTLTTVVQLEDYKFKFIILGPRGDRQKCHHKKLCLINI